MKVGILSFQGNVVEHKEILNELRVAGAGIMWTRMNEERSNGNIYWYDAVEVSQSGKLSNSQMSELFRLKKL